MLSFNVVQVKRMKNRIRCCKIMKKNALDDFIRSLLKHEILSISQIVFGAIVGLKRAHHREAPSKR